MSDLLDKLTTETHLNMILLDALVASTSHITPVIAQVDTSKVVWKDGRVVYVEKGYSPLLVGSRYKTVWAKSKGMSWLLAAIDLESGKVLLNANKKPNFVRPNMRYANGKKVSAGSKYFWTDIDSLVWIPSQPNKDRLTKHLQLTGEVQ